MPDDKRDTMLETDVREQHTNERAYMVLECGDHVGRIRREFMCSIVAALVACPEAGSDHVRYWDYAEALLLEGQRRGVLP